MKEILNANIEPIFTINTPHKTVVQSTIEVNGYYYLIQMANETIYVYKKSSSSIQHKNLTITSNDILKSVSGNAYGHSQSIGATSFPYTMPDGKLFLATGPDKLDESGFGANISVMSLDKEKIANSSDLYYISGFDTLLTNLQDKYNLPLANLIRMEFAIFNTGADLNVLLEDDAHNVFTVSYSVGLNDFFDNLKKGYAFNDISQTDYKWSCLFPAARWQYVLEELGDSLTDEAKSKISSYNKDMISLQGFTFINDELQNATLFISSQYSPEQYIDYEGTKKIPTDIYHIFPRCLLVIPPTNSYRFDEIETQEMQENWTFINLTNNHELDIDGYYTEFENIDYINKNSLFLTVAYHNDKDLTTKFSKMYKISW